MSDEAKLSRRQVTNTNNNTSSPTPKRHVPFCSGDVHLLECLVAPPAPSCGAPFYSGSRSHSNCLQLYCAATNHHYGKHPFDCPPSPSHARLWHCFSKRGSSHANYMQPLPTAIVLLLITTMNSSHLNA